MWVEKLCEDIRENGHAITSKELVDQFVEFFNSVEDVDLRKSYPSLSNIKYKWVLSGEEAPRKGGHDFLLSFLNAYYPNVKTQVALIITERILQRVKKEKPRTEMGKIIAKESYRRGSYWKSKVSHINEKYVGCYLLIRTCGDGKIVPECFAITLNTHLNNLLKAYWIDRHGDTWSGDLYVNSRQFTGILSRTSTDKLFEPITLTLLRSARVNSESGKMELMLTGEVTGWVDDSEEQIISTKIAAWKLPYIMEVAVPEDLREVAESDAYSWVSSAIERPNKLQERALKSYFSKNWYRTGKLSAKNSLQDLFSVSVFLEDT